MTRIQEFLSLAADCRELAAVSADPRRRYELTQAAISYEDAAAAERETNRQLRDAFARATMLRERQMAAAYADQDIAFAA